MSDYQIDPYKLNEVLQQILDRLASLDEKSNSASPEFQVLMNNYLTKANEAERNQARFEEALERLEIAQQEGKNFKSENNELKERIRSNEKDFDTLRSENTKEVNSLREEISKLVQSKNDIESVLSEKYTREISKLKSDTDKQISQLQAEVGDILQVKRKLEEKLLMKTQEADTYERELNDLKVKLADEQASIRNEIIEATKRSHQIEQQSQNEKEQMSRRIRELELTLEEVNSNLILKQREVEYKDALLNQTFKKSPTDLSNLSVNKTTSFNPSPMPPAADFQQQVMPVAQSFANQTFTSEKAEVVVEEAPVIETEKPKEKKSIVGGIWSKLSSAG